MTQSKSAFIIFLLFSSLSHPPRVEGFLWLTTYKQQLQFREDVAMKNAHRYISKGKTKYHQGRWENIKRVCRCWWHGKMFRSRLENEFAKALFAASSPLTHFVGEDGKMFWDSSGFFLALML